MNLARRSWTVGFAVWLVLGRAVIGQAVGPVSGLPAASVPGDGRITLVDYTHRDWGPELVRYRLDANRLPPGRLELRDEDGKAMPFQVAQVEGRSILSFIAAVAGGKSATYILKAGNADRSRENSTVFHRVEGDLVTLGNEHFALRLPRARQQHFTSPVAAQQVPPPILAWRPSGSDWAGGARFVTERRITDFEVRVLEDGPVTVVYECRYRFEPAGQYVWRVRVAGGIAAAMIAEEFDLGEVSEGRDFLMLGLGENWKPQEIGFLSGEGIAAQTPCELLSTYLDKKSREQQGALRVVGAYTPPSPPPPGKGLALLERITPGNTWGGFKGGCDLRGTRREGAKAAAESISLIPLHVGSWRRAMGLTAWHDPARGVQIALPIGVRPSRWYLDMADDRSPFSSHEHDPGLPASYGRREWALGFGLKNLAAARVQLGCIGLDRYKDWVLDWPEERAKSVYPRGLVTPELAARVRQNLAAHPERKLLEKLYIIDGKPATALANAQRAIDTFNQPARAVDWQVVGLSSYYTTYHHLWTIYANDALACGELPAETRRRLRRYLALYAYLFSDPDCNPRGSGCHLGNPNMPIGRSMALATMAPLLPDHPRYEYWMQQLRAMAAFRLASNTEPGGAWFEPPIYQFYGPARALTIAQVALVNCGFGDLSTEGWHKAALRYDANLTMPDPRFKGWRILPGMGNSGNTLEGIFGISMAAFDRSDRPLAGFLRWMHRLSSGNQRVSQGNDPDYSFFFLPDVPEHPEPLRTTFIPGYGVAFRAHYGTPDETAMLFRCGYNKSHWDMDDLNTILYGKGAPLSPGTGYQYYSGPAVQNEAIYHNRVKVGRLDAHEPFGRVENHVQDYGFGEWVDYAVGREHYPPEYFTDGKGEMDWRRHIVFLKSARPEGANYFVLRDTFPGGAERPTWWHWLNLDGPERILAGGNTIEMKTRYGAATHFWFAGRQALDAKVVLTFDYPLGPNYHHRAFGKELGVPNQEDKETKSILRVSGKPGEEYFYVVYPHKDAERLPAFAQPGEGCIKVTTAEATDYVFAGDEPLQFAKEDAVFTGKAGAVRVFPDRVVLCLSSGSGRVGYKGYVLEGHGPLERVVRLADLKPGVVQVPGTPRQVAAIQLDGGVTVTGELPLEAWITGQTIHIKTRGRARVLDVTLPPFIIRPELTFDGRQWMAGWSDYAGSDWGRMQQSYLMAVSTLDGEHELAIGDMQFPPVWDRPFVPAIERAK
jgi:hypothetical protein